MMKRSLATAVVTVLLAPLLPASAAPSPDVIATADGEQSGVRIDITELKRTSGDTVTMKFTLVNDSGSDVSPYNLFTTSQVKYVHLIDAAGKKKYLPIMDAKGDCVCSSDLGHEFPSGQDSMNLWAKFPAPPVDVKEVSVVFPHFIPTDAPLSE